MNKEEKKKLLFDVRMVAISINNQFNGGFFGVHQLAARLKIDVKFAEQKIQDLSRAFFLEQGERNGVPIYRIVLIDTDRIKNIKASLEFKTKKFSAECAFLNELLEILHTDEQKTEKVL